MKYNKINSFLISKYIAIKRRAYIFFKKDFNPYPSIPKGMKYSPSEFLKNQLDNMNTKLQFNQTNLKDKKSQQKIFRKKIENLIVIKKDMNFKIIKTKKTIYKNKYIRKRIYVSLAKDRELPIDILFKKDLTSPKGLILCMQGTNSGAHLNLGEIRMPADVFKVMSGSSLALQAADNNFIAISFDRVGYGERRETKLSKSSPLPVIDISLHTLALGGSLLGESLSELYTICNWLKKKYKGLPLWCVGYSSAGNIALIGASLFDKLIDGICVGGCIGLFKDTILKRGVSAHLEVVYCRKWFEQDMFLQLIAPKPCLIIAGIKDHIWPYKGAKKVVDLAKPMFRQYNSSKNLKLIKGLMGHTYYPDLMWRDINKYFKKY